MTTDIRKLLFDPSYGVAKSALHIDARSLRRGAGSAPAAPEPDAARELLRQGRDLDFGLHTAARIAKLLRLPSGGAEISETPPVLLHRALVEELSGIAPIGMVFTHIDQLEDVELA